MTPPDRSPAPEATPGSGFAPVGYPFPLRRGVAAGRLIAVSGQFGQVDFRLVSGGLEAQVRQALRNVGGILETHGAQLTDVVKTTVYLAHIDDFDSMNRTYLEFFDLVRLPARTTAGVVLPFGALVEIEVWARRPLFTPGRSWLARTGERVFRRRGPGQA